MEVMTSAEFDELPDRKVDALVAEKVMGATWFVNREGKRYLSDPSDKEIGKKIWNLELKLSCGDEPLCEYFYVPHYSTDLNACHEMEEALIQQDHKGVVTAYVMSIAPDESPIMNSIHATARQKCKAALMALGLVE